MVLVDLPGAQRPRDALTARMAKRLTQELEDADVALLVLNGEQGVGPGDRFIAASLAAAGTPVVVAVNKVDRLSRSATAEVLARAAELLGITRPTLYDLLEKHHIDTAQFAKTSPTNDST